MTRVKSALWDRLTDAQKAEINEIVQTYAAQTSGIMAEDVAVLLDEEEVVDHKGNPWCEAACDVAGTAAKAVCLKLVDPLAVTACILIVDQEQAKCKSNCKGGKTSRA